MNAIEKSRVWEKPPFDLDTKKEIQVLRKNPEFLEDSFYKDLEFGTGGMRGIMGVGSNRINKYTLGKAIQGLSNYLKKYFISRPIKTVVAYDCRNNSKHFAKIVANIFSANGIDCYLFTELRPTPELSFAVRKLKAQCGIVLTASHNPPLYNGLKVYWQDGGQIVPPHDKAISDQISYTTFDEINFKPLNSKIHYLDNAIDKAFVKASCALIDFNVSGKEDFKIVFTPLHGAGITLVPAVLKLAGFTDLNIVREQSIPDGNFPTIKSPNPEEPEALKMAIELADSIDADIVIGTDPDGDRLGLSIRDQNNEMKLLNGNQTMIVMTIFLLEQFIENKVLNKDFFIASTLVSSPMMIKIAEDYGIDCKLGLTGFKWIAKMIEDFPNQKFLSGGEESFGFMIGDVLRDKDAITSTLLACNLGSHLKYNNSSIFDYLIESYIKHGFFKEKLISITKKGRKGLEEISELMESYRNKTPTTISNIRIEIVEDYLTGTKINLITKLKENLNFPKVNFLRYVLLDESIISVRPSGTEPKIKYYISVKDILNKKEDYLDMDNSLTLKINELIKGIRI